MAGIGAAGDVVAARIGLCMCEMADGVFHAEIAVSAARGIAVRGLAAEGRIPRLRIHAGADMADFRRIRIRHFFFGRWRVGNFSSNYHLDFFSEMLHVIVVVVVVICHRREISVECQRQETPTSRRNSFFFGEFFSVGSGGYARFP